MVLQKRIYRVETGVSDEAADQPAATIEDIIRNLRSRIASDDQLETLLRSNPSGTELTSATTSEQEAPESLTPRTIIEPLFEVLGYPDLPVETGAFSPDYGRQADYSVVQIRLPPIIWLLTSPFSST